MAVHEARRAQYARRRDVLADGLEALGFTVPLRPGGAFYLYVDVSCTGMDAMDFCRELLEHYHVAATPGVDFGGQDPGRYVRFAFTTGEDAIRDALARMGRALADWGVA